MGGCVADVLRCHPRFGVAAVEFVLIARNVGTENEPENAIRSEANLSLGDGLLRLSITNIHLNTVRGALESLDRPYCESFVGVDG